MAIDIHDSNCRRSDSTGEKTFKERKKERGAGDISSKFYGSVGFINSG